MIKPENLDKDVIRLRAVEPEDVDFLLSLENNPDLWPVSNNLAPYSRYQIEQYVLNAPNDVRTNGQLRLMIDFQENDTELVTVGAVDLYEIDLIHCRAGLGITILEKYRQHGIASKALELAREYAAGHLQLHQLFCSIFSTNLPSIRLFENKGFTRCGIRKEWFRLHNVWVDEFLYQSFLREKEI